MNPANRLLPPSLIPSSLWDSAAGILYLPPQFAEAYLAIVDKKGLGRLADSRNPDKPPVGGVSQELADLHFAQAFDGAAARAQLAITDPRNELAYASDGFIIVLSGNSLCIADAPCGAGAAGFSFLACIAELRRLEVLPRLPLEIRHIGAEISLSAREHAQSVLEEIRPFLESQAIHVRSDFRHWDVLDQMSNTDLIRQITLDSPAPIKRLIVIAGFSNFLQRAGKMKDAEPQFGELFRHASGEGSLAIWLEPQMNIAITKGALLSRLVELAKSKWKGFVQVGNPDEPKDLYATSQCQFSPPRRPSKLQTVRLAVLRLDLVAAPE